jgi:hypothetical protein
MNESPKAVTARRWFAGVLALVILMSLVLVGSIQGVAAQSCSTQYKVQSGDTLSSIAVKYNTTVEAIAAANSLTSPYQIYVGQTLCIPAGASVSATGTVSSSSSSTSNKPGVTITPNGFYVVTVKTTKMAKNTPYYVRLYSGNNRPVGQGIRLGTIRTDKNGDATKSFGIPVKFYDKNALKWGKFATICLKNPWNDASNCQTLYMYP